MIETTKNTFNVVEQEENTQNKNYNHTIPQTRRSCMYVIKVLID